MNPATSSEQLPLSCYIVPSAGVLIAGLLLNAFAPAVETTVFARGAAYAAATLTGAPVEAMSQGWVVPFGSEPIIVTAACSGFDFWVLLSLIFTWRLLGKHRLVRSAAIIGMICAIPVTWVINGVRIIALAHAHRWIIPHWPEAYEGFLHLAVGVLIFLPALVAFHALPHFHRITPSDRTDG